MKKCPPALYRCHLGIVEQREKCGQVELLGFSTNKFAIYCTAVVFYVKSAQNKGSFHIFAEEEKIFILFLLLIFDG